MIDSSDWARLELAKHELFELLKEEDLKNAPILILANKQDLPGAMNHDEIANRLSIKTLQRNDILVIGVSAKFNTKVEGALDWLIANINNS